MRDSRTVTSGVAVEEGTEGVKVNAGDWEALRNIAIWYRDTGKADLAKEAATRARDIAPQDQRASIEALLTTLTATP